MTVTAPEWGGCAWPVDPACLATEWEALDPAVQDRSQALASATLTRLTGYRVGGCPVTVRPCKAGCAGGAQRPAYWDMQGIYGHTAGFWPHIEGGIWVNSCGCATDCSCSVLCEITLPGPVGRVDAVVVGANTVDPADYRVDGTRLVWTGSGDCPWPVCQDMAAPVGADDTFAVTYLNAYPVDALGAYAAGVLTMEYAKACTTGKCRLPSGVTSIARQGVSFEITSGAFPGGLTGIREVDAYLALWNPEPIRQAPQVWSPDLRTPRVVT
jgi:hypothetical protein